MKISTLRIACLLAAGALAASSVRLIAQAPQLANRSTPAADGKAAADPKGTNDTKNKPAVPMVTPEYRLGPGDKLRIEVYKDGEMSQSVQIRPDGKITLPLVGDIEATGKTPLELRDTVTKVLKDYMTNPVVTVIVVEATAAVAYIVGEVAHPGSVNLQAPLTVLQAVAMAGGLKDFADEKNIRILRQGPIGVRAIAFNYRDALRGGTPVYLSPGDTVVVP